MSSNVTEQTSKLYAELTALKEQGIEGGQQTISLLKKILEATNSSDYQAVTHLAKLYFDESKSLVENVEIEKVEPSQVFEKAILQNKVSVPLWEAYLKFSL